MEYLESPENFLWTILVGNTLANMVSVSMLVLRRHTWLGQWPVLLVTSFVLAMF